VETPVSLVDVAPTVLELLGLDPSASFRGESLLSRGARGKRPVIAEFFDPADSFHSWIGREKPGGDRADEPTDRLLILGDDEATLLRSDGSVAILDNADSRRPPGEHGPSPDDLLLRLGDWAPIVLRADQHNTATEPISSGRREKLEALGYLTREPATPIPLPEAAIDPSGAEGRP
jgi:hypothetical protein